MQGHTYIQQTKLTNVAGRIKYISSHAKQENLYAVYETTDRSYWRELAAENRAEFNRFGSSGKCIEARELIIALPPSMYEYNHNELLRYLVDNFKEQYGAECIAALHHNKRKTNLHIHLIYSEREKLKEPIIKTATRNIFIDENGKRRRTKKEIVNDDGSLRQGCRIIPKGEIYEQHLFDKKRDIFKDKRFLNDVKEFYTEIINNRVMNDEDKLKVFPTNSPYIATSKIGKNNPHAIEIQSTNRIKDNWNRHIDYALRMGIPRERLIDLKKQEIVTPIGDAIKAGADRHSVIHIFIERATRTLNTMIKTLFKMSPERTESALKEHFKEFVEFCRAPLIKSQKEERDAR